MLILEKWPKNHLGLIGALQMVAWTVKYLINNIASCLTTLNKVLQFPFFPVHQLNDKCSKIFKSKASSISCMGKYLNFSRPSLLGVKATNQFLQEEQKKHSRMIVARNQCPNSYLSDGSEEEVRWEATQICKLLETSGVLWINQRNCKNFKNDG